MKEEYFWILLSKKITGEASQEELKQLQALLDTNPEWMVSSERLHELWNSRPVTSANNELAKDAYMSHIVRLTNVHPDFDHKIEEDTDSFLEEEALDMEVKSHFFSEKKIRLTFAFALVLIILVGIKLLDTTSAIIPANTDTKNLNELTVTPGSKSKITLPDGSQVWINSGSKLKYASDFNGKNREVYLNGEAYFEVTKNPNKPFIVHTSGIDVKVLGTAFNVKAFEAEPTIETTLVHGSIEVLKNDGLSGASVLLKPHQKLVYRRIYDKSVYKETKNNGLDPDKLKTLSLKSLISINPVKPNLPDSTIVETAWVSNKLVFEEEKFADLAVKMERWYNIKINIKDTKLSNYRLSGSFVDETAEEAMNELRILIPFNYKIKNKEFLIEK